LASDLSVGVTGTTLHVDGGAFAASGFLNWPHGGGYLPMPTAGSLRGLFPAEDASGA
jgi:3-oxoacyl-[acyl-carrier protein] reductase